MNVKPDLKLIEAYLKARGNYSELFESGVQLQSVSLDSEGDLEISISGCYFGSHIETFYVPLLDLLAFVWGGNYEIHSRPIQQS